MISKTFRRALVGIWIIFGSIPMVYTWRLPSTFLREVSGDYPDKDSFTQFCFVDFIAVMACFFGFMYLLYLLTEIPAKKDSRDA